MQLGESIEDYLESILVLSSQLEHVRSVDVASHLGFSKPSVHHAVKVMQEQGLITMDKSKMLELTEQGRAIAQNVYNRHQFFCSMLEAIGVDRKTAEEDACRIEHVISDETFRAIQAYYQQNSSQLSKKE